jgi:hypothetical protein
MNIHGKVIFPWREKTTRTAGNKSDVHPIPGPLSQVDQWITRQKEPDLSRPEAIRWVGEMGLKVRK